MAKSSDILFMAEYIKDSLYFATVRNVKAVKSTREIHYFCIDHELLYENYYSDFGPLNLGCVYKYCRILNEKLEQFMNKQIVVHYTSIDPKKKANAAYLMGCFGVLYLRLTPKDALKPLIVHNQTYRSFQDASQGDSEFTITILDCLQALKKANDLNFFDFNDFNYEEYDRLDKIQGGDLNWIVPDKFLAFIGPVDCSVSLYHPPEMYLDYFLENDVKIVIRLNKKLYDPNVFRKVGIQHYDLFFPDGSCPPRHILFKFLQISEDSDCAIGVHCKAGLGRTGSLIGCYLMKHYRMTAREAIGWMRICRPGSVIGYQQRWLEELEALLIKHGNLYRRSMNQDINAIRLHEFGVYSFSAKTRNNMSRSPSPPMYQRRSNETTAPKAQYSKTRQAFSKTIPKEQYSWSTRSPKMTTNTKNQQQKGDSHDLASSGIRRGGDGEPRLSRCPIHLGNTNISDKTGKSKQSESNSRVVGYNVPYLHSPQGPVIKSISDAKNILMKSTISKEPRISRQLNSAITVTPQFTYRIPNITEIMTSSRNAEKAPSTVHTGSTQTQYRRRLGRSPSPPQRRNPSVQSRATNTAPAKEIVTKDSRLAIREALSRLKSNYKKSKSKRLI